MSSYSFDKYKQDLATDLTLADLQHFTERFLAEHRRQLQKKDEFFEFLVPDVLEPLEAARKLSHATFDRESAIRRTDADFLASAIPWWRPCSSSLGHTSLAG